MTDFTEGSRMRTNAGSSKTEKPNIISKGHKPMTEPDYKIEELYNTEELKVYFVIYGMYPTPHLATRKQFHTLEEAKEVVRIMRKYSQRVFHYVED